MADLNAPVPYQPALPICDSTLADRINAAHEACLGAARSALLHALDAGELLVQAKASVPHGAWSTWLAEHFRGSERTAQAYMRLARRRADLPSNPQRVADLTVREAMALLSDDAFASPERPEDLDPDPDADADDAPLTWEEHLWLLRDAHRRLWTEQPNAPATWTDEQRPEYAVYLDFILGCIDDDERAAEAWATLNGCTLEEGRRVIADATAKTERFQAMDPFGEGSGRMPLSGETRWDWPRHDKLMALPMDTPEQVDVHDRALGAFWETTPENVREARERRAEEKRRRAQEQ